jgi:hypothetical protein
LDDEGVDQIVGGTPAAAGEFPFQVIILIYLLLNNYCLSAKYYFKASFIDYNNGTFYCLGRVASWK